MGKEGGKSIRGVVKEKVQTEGLTWRHTGGGGVVTGRCSNTSGHTVSVLYRCGRRYRSREAARRAFWAAGLSQHAGPGSRFGEIQPGVT